MNVLSQLYVEFQDEPGRLRMVLDDFVLTVGGSFLADGSKMPVSEVKRRTELCAKWFMTFRRDLGWSMTRALDELPKALRHELDGIPYTPTREGKSTWAADNGRDLIYIPE